MENYLGELRKSFFYHIKRLYASVKTSASGSTHITLIAKFFADALTVLVFENIKGEYGFTGSAIS